MSLRIAELETLFTANVDQVEKAEKYVKATAKDIEGKPLKLGADGKGATAAIDQVAKDAKKLVSQNTAIQVNANIERADKGLDRTQKRLDYLRSVETTMDVRADVARAEATLQRLQRQRDGLVAVRAEMTVDANEGGAKQKLTDVAAFAKDAGKKGGADAGAGISGGIVAALASIPIAGAIVGVGAVAGKFVVDEFKDALKQDVGYDRLAGLTGISEKDALRLGRAAGEAYANTFGESVEANMDTARLALQFNLIDANTSTRDAQRVVEGLAGIADVLDEDVKPTATAVTTLLRTGLAKSADEAYDLLATGAREGLNRNEDLLDTLTEYPVVMAKLGLSGSENLGLIAQAMDAGARNTDVAADALKEFQIRATDGSKLSAEGFQALGLNAERMTAKIARGGADAREGLDVVLDRLREMKDPVERNAAAVALFGTKAEDLGDALFAMDPSSAVEKLNGVQGSAQKMFDTLADNDATRVERAFRNVELAADGIKGAIASGLSEPIGQFADWVSANRGPVLQFFTDLIEGGFNFGIGVVNGLADATDGIGEFVSGPLAFLVAQVGYAQGVMGDKKGSDATIGMANRMVAFKDTAGAAADVMRDRWIPEMEAARDKAIAFGDGAVALGYVSDTTIRLTTALEGVGVAADGGKLSLEGVDLANLRASESGAILEGQIRTAIGALGEQVAAAGRAGESEDQLTQRRNQGRDALVQQMVQMGLTDEQARALIDTVNATPPAKSTTFSTNAPATAGEVAQVRDRANEAQGNRDVTVTANTGQADTALQGVLGKLGALARKWSLDFAINTINGFLGKADGGIVEFMAGGGVRGTPMQSIAQMVPPSTYRVVGDRTDVAEAYIPLDGSPRSMAILAETMRRMGVEQSVTLAAPPASGSRPVTVQQNITTRETDPRIQVREWAREAGRAFAGL